MKLYARVLRNPDFRYLFLGQAASMIGDYAVVVALGLFVTQLTGSPTDLGLVLGARAVPLVALLLFGGVWADRLPRQKIMITADVIRAALHATLAALILAGAVRIWQLIAIEAAFGAAQAFFQPAYTGLVPQTVPEELIQDANALTASIDNLAFLLGPTLATVLVLGVGAGEAFALDAVTFVLSAILLARVHPRARGESTQPAPVLAELHAGWREVRSRPWVWVTIAAFAGAVLCVYSQWYVLAPEIARHLYGSVGVFGLLEAIAGVGALAGSAVALHWRPRRPLRTGLLMILSWPVLDGAFALGLPLEVVVPLALTAGYSFSLFGVWWETALAQNIPPGSLSRVSAYDWMGSLALMPLGYLLGGPLASAIGLQTVLAVGSLIGLVLLTLALLPRSTRELGAARSAEHVSRELGEEARGEREIAHVDSLVGVVHQRPGLE